MSAGVAARPPAAADVCLILEGTYPYVTGGVSEWLHRLVLALPEIRFAILHIAATVGEPPPRRYTMPPNVVELVDVGIHGGDETPGAGEAIPPAAWDRMRAFHDELRRDDVSGWAGLLEATSPAPGRGPSAHELIYGRPAWDVVRQLYEERAPEVSFIDYFWTWRFTHLPIFRLMHARLPQAAIYHTVSTGWAGLVASLARARTGRPMILTEHGIYARERRMEIDQATWIYVQRQTPMTLQLGQAFFKELWTRLFMRLSRLTYAHADLITTIYEGNRQAQLRDGADPAKTLVIPNGIDATRFAELAPSPPGPGEFRVGFVGRVVPIKDVKTLLRAFKIVIEGCPGASLVLAGPVDEDVEYATECRTLAATLGLDGRVQFLGRADVREIYPRIDAMVLTSLSEGLPLVILEAQAAAIPVVATDVGACRELLEGRTREDRLLGPSGLVTGIANPPATAEALLALARDVALRQQMGQAGQQRVRAHYAESDVVLGYRDIYRRFLAEGSVSEGPRGVGGERGAPGCSGRAPADG